MTKFTTCIPIAFIFFFSFATEVWGQSENQYFRYFEVEIRQLTQEEFDLLKTEGNDIDHLNFEDACPQKASLIISVNANYPKRIDDIELEIRSLIGDVIPSKRVKEIKSISPEAKSAYCK